MTTLELQPSKLGTREHWDNVYDGELANFEETGDEGEIWFGEESVEEMVNWALEYVPPSSAPRILEVGSGNGTLLFALLDAEYRPERLYGIDYSPGSVKLARSIAIARGGDNISFQLCDILKEDPSVVSSMSQENGFGWDLILDKGTFDAIALGLAPFDGYPSKIAGLLKPGGYFLITSCNFTEDELKAVFSSVKTNLAYHSRIQHATITFGGKSGSICSSVAFQKPSSPIIPQEN